MCSGVRLGYLSSSSSWLIPVPSARSTCSTVSRVPLKTGLLIITPFRSLIRSCHFSAMKSLVSAAPDGRKLERLGVLPLLGGRTRSDFSHGIGRARGACTQDGHGGVEGRVLGGEVGEDAIVEECDGRLGAKAAMALDLAQGVGQRPALDHETIQTHPGGRAVHAGVAVHQDRPGGAVLGQRQGLGDVGLARRVVAGLVGDVIQTMLAGKANLIRKERTAFGSVLGKQVD